ncbi:hypothetical protein [Spirulina sp. 06S082]|uniref:hypothetical protein n=1 Tax=Spirulina sp. 06S082 TaxID=3110248 RepID=UPI002B21C7F1|nr:hypothetical protein [Spirulina sp. 06S082]MEA5472316.1 hypothetical protein [Spirulina sp. 06S082]
MIILPFEIAPPKRSIDDLELIEGLIWIPELLTKTQQRRLRYHLDRSPWQSPPHLPNHHRQQCYGWVEKPPSDRSVLNPQRDYLGTLPDWLNGVLRRLEPWMPQCDQVIAILTTREANSRDCLPPGLHLDSTRNFDNAISMIALSPLELRFRRGTREPVKVELDAGDALIMRDEARYKWLHQVVFDDAIEQLFLPFRQTKIGSQG